MSTPATELEWEFADHVADIWQPYRIKILKGGRGGVKSWTAARYLLIDGYQQPLRVLCGREVQKSIKESVHQLLTDQIELLGLGGFYEVLSNEIRGRNGTKFTYAGISQLTTDSIKSYEGYDKFWGEEAQGFSRRSIDRLTPTFRKPGSELIFTLNPELDTDEIWQRYIEDPDPDTLILDCSYHNNPWFPDVLEKERQKFLRQVEQGKRRQYEYDWMWEGKCKPAVEGAIYPDEIAKALEDKRLCAVPYDPTLKVFTIWDLGWNDNMCIGFVQKTATAVFIIDYIEDSHRTYESYVNEIKAKEYNLVKSFIPHDARQHTAQTGKSDKEILEALGLKVEVIPEIGVKPGIEAARQMFHRVYFDKAKCTPLFNRLRRYARVINSEGVAGSPKHDDNSHGADMFRYIAVIENELVNEDENMDPITYDNRGIV